MITQLKNRIHFLRIGKTGSTAIRTALKDGKVIGKYELILHPHRDSLKVIPEGEKVVFFLREPIARFISGFYSRKRKGQPRYYSEWNDIEKEIFSMFETPNELASTLADKDSELYPLALKAMGHVKHTEHFSKWLISKDYLKSRKDDLFLIGFQETLNNDFDKLKVKLNLSEDVSLPNDDVGAHRNPEGVDKSLNEKAKERLEEWYQEDIKMISYCKKIMPEN